MHSISSGFIAAGCYYSTVCHSAHEHRFSTQRRIVANLDRRIERIHVDMENHGRPWLYQAQPGYAPPTVTDASPKPRRRLALDALRGLAVFLMIEQHVGIWVWEGPEPARSVMDVPEIHALHALGATAPPQPATLAGSRRARLRAGNRPGAA